MALLLDGYNDSSLQRELDCLLRESHDGFCPHDWDRVLCWPSSEPGTLVTQQCFAELNGIPYDTSQNASRWCHANATWDGYSNYSLCRDLREPPTSQSGVEVTTTLYYVGYSLSLVALSVAVSIFLYFKDLRCLRNTIHTNLMCTYILADFIWMLTATLQITIQMGTYSCIVLVLTWNYFHLTTFFWMFVEGLYLYLLVVETFTGKNIQMKVYMLTGWGAPIIITCIWGIAKGLTSGTGDPQVQSTEPLLRHCPWMNEDTYDWIYQAPAVGVLLANLAFLFMIMWVLITKLRSANTMETQQYRKATKALLVLIPLLGITYIIVIVGPTEGISAEVYGYTRAVLLSTQGFAVALFYCFLNSEVQNTMRHRFNSWHAARTLGGRDGGGSSRRHHQNNYHSTSMHSKDWSTRSRTESIRMPLRVSWSTTKRGENPGTPFHINGSTTVPTVSGSSMHWPS